MANAVSRRSVATDEGSSRVGSWAVAVSFPQEPCDVAPEENGLRFADPGTVVSTGEFRLADSLESSCSIEVWAQPGLAHASGPMLAFHTARNPLQLALRQSDTDLWRASSSATKKARSPVPTGSAKGTL